MAGPSVIVLPQWQGSVRPLARQLVSGAARLAALARGMGAQVLEPGGFGAGRSLLRAGVDSYDVLLAAHARATQVLPDGPLLAIGGDCGADLGPAARALRHYDGELAIVHRRITVRSYGAEPRAGGPVLPLPVGRLRAAASRPVRDNPNLYHRTTRCLPR